MFLNFACIHLKFRIADNRSNDFIFEVGLPMSKFHVGPTKKWTSDLDSPQKVMPTIQNFTYIWELWNCFYGHFKILVFGKKKTFEFA